MEVRRYSSTLTKDQEALYTGVIGGSLERVRESFQPFSKLNGEKRWFDYWLLIQALRKEHTDIANFLIENDCRVKIPERTKQYCTPLYYACKMEKYNKETIELLIRKGASIRDKDFEKKTTIELALEKRHSSKQLIDFIVQSCHSLFERDTIEENADIFQLACWKGYTDIVQEFISKGINVNGISVLNDPSWFRDGEWRGFTPLHFAVCGSQKAICHLLLKHGADIHARNAKGETAIHLAFKNENHSMFFCDHLVEEFLRNLKDSEFSNSEDDEGISHFHIICSSHVFSSTSDTTAEQKRYMEHLKIIQFYIDKGVDVNLPVPLGHEKYPGFTALHFAVSSSALEISKLLLQNGANPKRVNGVGHTPLHQICDIFDPDMRFEYPMYENDNQAIIKQLLDHGVNRDDAGSGGSTPLHLAFYNKAEDNSTLDFLLSQKPLDKNLTNDEGLSYFLVACAVGNLSTVKTLVSRGASVNSRLNCEATRFGGMSALNLAVFFTQKNIVDFLLAQGAEVNGKTPSLGMTPLHLACEHLYTKFFKFSYLYDKSSNPDRFNVDWESNRKDQFGIISSLLKYGGAVNEKTSDHHTPLSVACLIPINNIMELYQGPPVAQNYYRNSILNEIRIRQEHIVDTLLRHGAEIRAHDFPVFHAAIPEMVDRETFEIGENLLNRLLERGMNVNAAITKDSAATLLHTAAVYGPEIYASKIVSKLLTQPPIKVDAKSSSGETPLHFAVRACRSSIVKKLLEAGADVNIVNNANDSPVKVLCDILRDKERDIRDFDIIHREVMLHLMRLMKLNLLTIGQNKRCLKTLMRFNDFPSSWPSDGLDEKIDTELEALKSRKVDAHTSLFDILRKDANDMAKFVRNVVFKEIVESPQLLTEYPVFHVTLRAQARVGIMKNMILESAKKVLDSLIGINWPEPRSDNILRYLGDSDLEILSELKIHRKLLKRKANECPLRGTKSPAKKLRCEYNLRNRPS